MVDDFKGIETAFSLGVGRNVDWDHAIGERGGVVHQFDHTVDAPPRPHRNFRFHIRKIAAVPLPECDTLASMLGHALSRRPVSSILKIDIENDEWDVFAASSQDVLAHFSQIVCEFHAFEHFHKDWHFASALRALHNLKQQFEVIHIHANNVGDITYLNGAPLPAVVEATFVNRARYDTCPTRETFPSALDRPNDPRKPDYRLGRFEL